MSNTRSFIESARAQLDELGQDIEAFEAKARSAKDDADTWLAEKTEKLRRDWSEARAHVETMADQEHDYVEAGWDKAKTDAQRQWNALQKAIQTYRAHAEGGTQAAAAAGEIKTGEAAK